MGPLVGETELPEAILKAGKDLLEPHSSTDSLLDLLHKVETLLSIVEQDPIVAVQSALRPSTKALISADLLRNPDSDVRVYVVSCLTEIMRITAPEAPYNDDHMKDIFEVTVEAFGKLADASSRSYKKAEAVLDTVAKVRSSLVMLDLECDDVILEMFRQFLKVISPDHPQPVLHSMETIMITVIDESEEVSMDLLEILLAAVKKESQDVSPMASKLVEKVLSSCASTLRPCIMEALKSTGTSLEMYSPVVSSICQSEAATTEAQIVVNPKETEAGEKTLEEQVVPSDSLKEKLDLGLSVKGARSKRTARGGTRANGDDKVTKGSDLQQLLKQGHSESTDTDTESGSARRRGRKPNSLMNPEEGYSFKTSSGKNDSSRGKLAGKKAPSPSKVAQTNQPVVISLSPSSKSRKKGSGKRSRSKMEETDLDAASLARPVSKKPTVKKDEPEEEDLMETDIEKPEDGIKTAKPSKKEKKAENGSAKTSAKKPLEESKTSGKKIVHSEAKKNNSKTDIPQSSKSKKKSSPATTPATKESEQTPKSHPKRKRTAGEEVESNKSKLGQELVGKRVKVWWPLDKKFYEGVIQSYDGRTRRHKVLYSDGEAEAIYLKNETWEIIQDKSSASEQEKEDDDLPDSTPLSDIMRRQKAKKSKNVELSSSSDVRSSKEKEPVTNSTKQGKRKKGALKSLSNEPESREEKDVKSSKEPKAETGRTKKRQKVARDMHRESEKDCDDKEEAATKGEGSVKSDAEPECKRDHQELADDPNAETKTDGEELKSTNKSNAEPEIDGEEQETAKEPTAELKIDGEEQEPVKEIIEETETEAQEGESAKEPNADTKLIEKEDMSEVQEVESAKEPSADTKLIEKEDMSAVQEVESAKEPSADTKLIEKEDMSEEQVGESAKEPSADTKLIEKEDMSAVQEVESAKEPSADTKLIEKEDMSEVREGESAKEPSEDAKEDISEEQSHGAEKEPSVTETGKVENEAEEDDQRAVKEVGEETDKAEAGTTPVSG
ncbi:PREDICTED: A-kinase anchor protein 12-like isoform X3 [Brassica oleracea var. oleracea]|uniref:A-kinase anchor protein 12-like isoform X3 n=1 Tax=Brassica oleracea var. oleracea TaxID=109376 RepID=UPI0006A715BC|nr:PREDICTED: A-kinase anchor protein 12-like isoform X3 [Brassica oleracea var. oleracea]